MQTIVGDIRFAIRQLIALPGFAVVAVLTLSLGIGATTAIFSVVNGVLLRPLPYPEPDRIVRVLQVDSEGRQMNVSDPNFTDWREQSRSFEELSQFSMAIVSVNGGSEPARVPGAMVSRGFFELLGVRPALGRSFLPEEQRPSAPPAVIVSHGFWQRYLEGDRDISSRHLSFDNRSHAVVGVMPAGFDFPGDVQFWIARELLPVNPSRTSHSWRVVGRLRPDVSLEQARQEMSAISKRLETEHGENTWMSDAAVVRLQDFIVGDVRPALLLLAGAAIFLLLIACANVINLLLARAVSRQRELAIRVALGARRGRLARQLVTEALVPSLAGGILGVLLAAWGVDLLAGIGARGVPRLQEVRIDAAVLFFSLGVSVLASVAIGLVTAWRAADGHLSASLAGGQRTHSGSAGSARLRGVLVVSQVALTLVLLVGSGLLIRSFVRVVSQDSGFRTKGALVMTVALPSMGGDGRARLASFHDELLGRLGTIPGVQRVGGANALPLGGNYANGQFLVLHHPDEVRTFDDFRELSRSPDRVGYAEFRVASEGYFRTMSIPVLAGRVFDDRDGPETAHVAAISESLARTRWPNDDPIGRLVQYGNMDGDLRPFTIIGVVGDVREASLEAEPQPTFYALHRQRPAMTSNFSYVMQGPADPSSVIPQARAIVRELDAELPPSFRTLEQAYASSLATRRFNMLLLVVFGGTALALAVMGIYGLMAFSVAQRTREIGVRVALGAPAWQVLRTVVAGGLTLTSIGILIGVAAALAATRLMSSLLYGVTATDTATYLAAALLMLLVALLSAYVPARRATRVDPVTALRGD
jgi:putative ABC transport system permease protein